MNLKLSVPKGVDIDSVSFSLPFDIDKKAKNANGHLTATKDKLTVYYDDKAVREFAVSDISKITGRTAYRLFDAVRKGYARQGHMRLSVFAEVLYALCGACKDI